MSSDFGKTLVVIANRDINEHGSTQLTQALSLVCPFGGITQGMPFRNPRWIEVIVRSPFV